MTFKERILLVAATKPAWQRYAATVLFLIIVICFWWFLAYRELYTQLQERIRYAVQQRESPQAVQLMPELSKSSSIELAGQQFFVMPSMATIVQKIISSCQQHTLSIESYVVADRQIISWGIRTSIKLVIVGDFFNMLKFFEALQPVTNIVFESCEMELVDGSTLRCSNQLSVYTPTDIK